MTTGEKQALVTSITGKSVYINQIQEDEVTGFDNQPSFFAYRMLTDGNHATIRIGDEVTDDLANVYTVRGKSISQDLTGTHHQYLLIIAVT